jgi:hypothetical protein
MTGYCSKEHELMPVGDPKDRVHLLTFSILKSHKLNKISVRRTMAAPSSQIQALELLFNATKGDQWQWEDEVRNGPKWSFSSPQADPCSDKGRVWQGITCSSQPSICKLQSCEIMSVELNDYNMKGNLPSQFFVLDKVRNIHLSGIGWIDSIRDRLLVSIGFLRSST